MNLPRISIIMPTCGRRTLDRAVQSARQAMGPDDELLVVGDGPLPAARDVLSGVEDSRVRYIETVPTHKYGCHQYDVGSMLATGDYLMFFTDDDLLVYRAADFVRLGVAGRDPHPHVFAMEHRPQNRVLRNSIAECEVGAHQIVVPNIKEKLARWADNTTDTNDHAYLMATLRNWKMAAPEFHNEIIATMLVHNMGRLP